MRMRRVVGHLGAEQENLYVLGLFLAPKLSES